jgi:hypothetical protein
MPHLFLDLIQSSSAESKQAMFQEVELSAVLLDPRQRADLG